METRLLDERDTERDTERDNIGSIKRSMVKKGIIESLSKLTKKKCSICKKEGHRSNNQKFHPKIVSQTINSDVVLLETFEEEFSHDILSCENWKNTITFQNMKDKKNQYGYYEENHSSLEVLQLVGLDSKSFGSISEKIICEIFNIGPRTSPQNDGIFNDKKIEIKTARYWSWKDDCKWQHLEPDYDYDYVIMALLDFHSWKIWGIDKRKLWQLRDKNIVTYQGKQGWWTTKTQILPYLKPIHSIQDFCKFIK
jgi:hypothetical protein